MTNSINTTIARIFSGPVMFLLGLNHFVMPEFYGSIVPAFLPGTRALVYGSGIAEMVGAVGTMHPATRRRAGWFLIALLIAIFPANVYMVLDAERFPEIPLAALIARLPLQLLFIYWVYVATIRDRPERSRTSTRRDT